jgi:N-acetylneuraminate synthase
MTQAAAFEIAGRAIGPEHPVYVIAELSANHHQDWSAAEALVRAAAGAGADAVKLQTYTPDTITIDARNEHFRIDHGTPWDGRVLYDLYAEAHTPWKWHAPLAELAGELGLHCFSSAFDPSSVDFLESQGVPAYKVASFELVDVPLLRRIAATGKPMIVSTGMATLAEIDEAVRAVRDAGAPPLALLRTSSAYPAPASGLDLRSIEALRRAFGTVVGLSDHTLGIAVPVAAVAVGACIVEKHLTLSRDVPGPDSAFSLEPSEFRAMVEALRTAEQALGGVRFGPSEAERPSLAFRRSLFVVADVKAGDRFTAENVRSIRPAAGLHPRHLDDVIGRRAARDAARGTPLSWDLVAGGE